MGAATTNKTASLPDTKLLSCSPSASKLLFELEQAELVTVIAEALQECATSNDEAMEGKKQDVKDATRFHAKQPPPISLQSYLQRLLQLTPYPLDALLLAVVYINRVTHLTPPRPVAQDTIGSCPVRSFRPLLDTCQQQLPLHDPAAATANKSAWCATDDKFGGYSTATRSDVGPPSFEEHSPSVTRQVAGTSPPPPPLTRYTAHRLMLAALVVAARYGSDYNITRVRAAKVAGLPVDELFLLELDFFALLSFGCRVRSTELEAICAELWYRTNAGKQEQAGRPADARSAADVPTDGGEPRLCGSDDNDREDVRNRSSVEFCFTPPARRMSGYADKRLPGRFPLSPGGPFDVDGTPSATPPLSEGESDSSYFSSSSLSSTDEGREYGSLDCKATAPSASRTVTPTLISQLSIS